jgi:hypothetical protein
MKKIGIKILKELSYETFESFQYLLDYDFEYDDVVEYVKEQRVIELDIEDEDKEDRVEDIEVLTALLLEFDKDEVEYELYIFDTKWERIERLNSFSYKKLFLL